MLFYPWRNEESLLNGLDSYKAIYQQNEQMLLLKRQEYEHSAEVIDEAMERARTEENQIDNVIDNIAPHLEHDNQVDASEGSVASYQYSFFDPERPRNQCVYDICSYIGLAPRASDEEVEILAGRIPNSDYRKLIQSLNIKQMEFFTFIMNHVKCEDVPMKIAGFLYVHMLCAIKGTNALSRKSQYFL